MNMRIFLFLSLAISTFAVFAGLTATTLIRLVRSGTETEATITRFEPENHQRVYYEYRVGGTRYESFGSVGKALHVGERAIATYLPDSPEVSIIGNPRDQLRNELTFSALVGLFLSGFIVYGRPPERGKFFGPQKNQEAIEKAYL